MGSSYPSSCQRGNGSPRTPTSKAWPAGGRLRGRDSPGDSTIERDRSRTITVDQPQRLALRVRSTHSYRLSAAARRPISLPVGTESDNESEQSNEIQEEQGEH
jgi:hypothetical protein